MSLIARHDWCYRCGRSIYECVGHGPIVGVSPEQHTVILPPSSPPPPQTPQAIETMEMAVERIVRERLANGAPHGTQVEGGWLLSVAEAAYMAGVASGQAKLTASEAAYAELVEAVKLEMLDVTWPGDGSPMYPRVKEALAALPSRAKDGSQ